VGGRLAFGRVLGQTGLLNPPAIALVPRQRGHGLEPVGRDRGHRVQRSAEGFRHEFEPVEHPDRREHMRRVGAAVATGLEPPHGAAALQQLVEEELFGAPRQQAVPEFAQHRKVESRVSQLETQQILPVDARAHGLRRLAICQVLRNCMIVTNASRHGGKPGCPPIGNKAAKSSSERSYRGHHAT